MLNTTNRQRLLVFLALLATLFFSIALTLNGINSFHHISGSLDNFNSGSFTGFSLPRLVVNLAYLSLIVLYLIWIFWNTQTPDRLGKILKYSSPFLLLAYVAYPLSVDVYLYLHYGLMGLQGFSPYLNPASSFSSELSSHIAWSGKSTYGPISQIIFMATALGVKISPFFGVYCFKIFCLFAHVLNTILIWQLLKDSQTRSKATMAYLINPAVLSAYVADAHVDVFLCSTVIIVIGCLHNRRIVAAILALWIGVLTKTLPIIWIPLVVSFLIARRYWRTLAIATVFSGLIVIGASSLALPNLAAWKSLLNSAVTGLTARSMHHIVNLSLGSFWGTDPQVHQSILSQITQITYVGFCAYYGWVMLKPYFQPTYSEKQLVVDIGWITLALFLFATPWLMPWYPVVLWSIGLLCFSAPTFLLVNLAFCLSPGIIYGTGSGLGVSSTLPALLTIAPPITIILLGKMVTHPLRDRLEAMIGRQNIHSTETLTRERVVF